MNYIMRISSYAEKEMQEACTWYESSRAGLGQEFFLCVEDVFANILERPLSYPEVHGSHRRALVLRFPFAVFFRIEKTVIKIVAVWHTRRSPTAWKTHLSKQ